MNLSLLRLVPVLVLSLLFGGCATVPGGAEEGADGAAPVSDADSGGAETAGAIEGGAWTGSPLDDPDSLLSTRTILFDYDSSDIREDFRDVVLAHGEYLAANPMSVLTIEGHADERGSREYNVSLGERRANTVKRLLLTQGASENQITTVSYGEEHPLALGSDETSWAQNRRAELVY